MEYNKKYLEEYLKKNYPELFKEHKLPSDFTNYVSLDDISIGFLVKTKQEFGDNSTWLCNGLYYLNEQKIVHAPLIDIFINVPFVCKGAFGGGMIRTLFLEIIDKDGKSSSFRTLFSLHNIMEGHFNKDQYAIFPYKILDNGKIKLFPNIEIESNVEWPIYTYKQVYKLINKIYKDKFIMKSIKNELANYGVIKKMNKEENLQLTFT